MEQAKEIKHANPKIEKTLNDFFDLLDTVDKFLSQQATAEAVKEKSHE